jgi:ATP-dependent DNA helicase RecG
MQFVVPLAEPLIVQVPESRPGSQLESRLESQPVAKVLLRLQAGEAGKSVLAESLGHKTVSGELEKQI